MFIRREDWPADLVLSYNGLLIREENYYNLRLHLFVTKKAHWRNTTALTIPGDSDLVHVRFLGLWWKKQYYHCIMPGSKCSVWFLMPVLQTAHMLALGELRLFKLSYCSLYINKFFNFINKDNVTHNHILTTPFLPFPSAHYNRALTGRLY